MCVSGRCVPVPRIGQECALSKHATRDDLDKNLDSIRAGAHGGYESYRFVGVTVGILQRFVQTESDGVDDNEQRGNTLEPAHPTYSAPPSTTQYVTI
jgi:hypothetical protein